MVLTDGRVGARGLRHLPRPVYYITKDEISKELFFYEIHKMNLWMGIKRGIAHLSNSVATKEYGFVQSAESGEDQVFHKGAVENSLKMWKTQNAARKDGGKHRCKAEVTHTFHRWAVENSKITEVRFSAFCLLDNGIREKMD